jgi:hypothetical protein
MILWTRLETLSDEPSKISKGLSMMDTMVADQRGSIYVIIRDHLQQSIE